MCTFGHTDTQSEIFDKHNIIFMILFGMEELITLGKDVLNRFLKKWCDKQIDLYESVK